MGGWSCRSQASDRSSPASVPHPHPWGTPPAPRTDLTDNSRLSMTTNGFPEQPALVRDNRQLSVDKARLQLSVDNARLSVRQWTQVDTQPAHPLPAGTKGKGLTMPDKTAHDPIGL